ncbi:hypothetical protein TNCV_1104231 [Trichonephila clavipes]|nr:hypothetical protein TNCV_1104231 [Trichonephila clavipes]
MCLLGVTDLLVILPLIPLGKSLDYQFALFTTNPSEEENRAMQIKLTIYCISFLARKESRRGDKPEICDEAHFWLNGYVNKQNCRIWSEANPQVYVETPLHPEKLTVWCAL